MSQGTFRRFRPSSAHVAAVLNSHEGVNAMRRQLSIATAGAIAFPAIALFALNARASAAAAIDASAAVRGSLGVPLEELEFHSVIGNFTLYANGALALLFAVIVAIMVRAAWGKRNDAQRTVRAAGGAVHTALSEATMRLSRPVGG
jgi:hypothetical protein